MSSRQKSVLVFGGGALQLSILQECKNRSLFTVVIDPDPSALGKEFADAFEVVGGDDFEATCAVVEKYNVDGILTAATDKPLIMMAKVAERYGFPFFSEQTAINSTDKHLMKRVFQANGIPCANGKLIKQIDNSFEYPLILKPRDNSGSRGILFCRTEEEAKEGITAAFEFSKKDTVLAEEFIEGKEYSIEALHFDDKTVVVQMTEKLTTPYPYNVELGHIQPAVVSQLDELRITELIGDISIAMDFRNCASHTELKINDDGIFVIETSPRLGGDFITSSLTTNSTAINMERELTKIAIGEFPELPEKGNDAAAIFYFDFFEKMRVTNDLSFLEQMKEKPGVVGFSFELERGAEIPRLRNSLDRYGYLIIKADDRESLKELAEKYMDEIKLGI